MEETHSSPEVRCTFCRGPFHIATGGLVGHPTSYPFCGACVRDSIDFMKRQGARRWGKQPFYKHATVPPPAVFETYVFHCDDFRTISEGSVHKTFTALRAEGVTMEEAYLKIENDIPTGHRVWTWHVETEEIRELIRWRKENGT